MSKTKRLYTVDALRGVAVIAMCIFHALWDVCYMFYVPMPTYTSRIEDVFGFAIGFTFVLISGFSFGLGKRHLKRGLQVICGAAIICAVTLVIMPRMPIYFGVLSLIGSMMIIMIPLSFIIKRINPYVSLVLFITLFALTFNVKMGYIGFGELNIPMPSAIYSNLFSAYFGFPPSVFSSSDYYPLIPWGFLYISGYSVYLLFKRHSAFGALSVFRIPPLEWIGRHALIIYLLHQPLIYAVLYLILK